MNIPYTKPADSISRLFFGIYESIVDYRLIFWYTKKKYLADLGIIEPGGLNYG